MRYRSNIYRFLSLIIISILLIVSNVSADEPILTLDTGGHMALIWKIIPMKDGRRIISASADKTIRIWDIETGKETQKLLGQIGGGSEGAIYAIALSPDEKWLAVGGYFGGNIDTRGNIRIYDIETGKIINVLKSHKSSIYDLSVSSDGRYLVSGSADKMVKVWDIQNNFSEVFSFDGHTDHLYAVRIFKEGNDYKIVSAGFDNRLILCSLNDKKQLNSYTHSDKLRHMAINEKYIIVSAIRGKKIEIFDHNLNKIKEIVSDTNPEGLSFSPDGRLLLAGTGITPYNCSIYDTTDDFKKISTFSKHDNLTMAAAFIDNHTAVTGGGNDEQIYLWDAFSGAVKKQISGHGKRIWAVGIKDKEIAFGNTLESKSYNNRGKFEKIFNLDTFSLKKTADTQEFKRMDTNYQAYSLNHAVGGDFGFSNGALVIKENGKEIGRILRTASNGYSHRSYGFTGDGTIITGGTNGHLMAYNLQGQMIARFIGHSGIIWSIAVDGDTLVSGSDDQTIMLWDLKEIKAGKKNLYPIVTIFVSDDNEWVVWTNEGFFSASKNGSRYIAYHMNRGPDKEAGIVTIDKFYNSFYRPDLIDARLNGRDIVKYTKEINIETILKGGLPPRVEMITTSGVSQTKDIKLKARICDTGNGIGDITLFINDVPISIEHSSRGVSIQSSGKTTHDQGCSDFEKLISLQQGTNKIGIMAMNKGNNIESNRPEIELVYKSKTIEKPDLHIMTIAIDKYNDIDLRLKYSVNDASGIIETIKKHSAPLFKNIYVYSIHDGDATKANIQKRFEEIKTNTEDVFLLFIAGHGITYEKDGSYYYIPVNFRFTSAEAIPQQGISKDDFMRYLTNVKALKSLLLLDTCNSGSFTEAKASRGMLEKTAINKLNRATGRSTIVASSKDQVALEGIEGHGVFTFSVLKALNGLDKYSNNQLTINALATIVEETLPEITMKKWGYEQIPQKNLQGMDFPISMK
ncbi:MAG: caspase family protein [Nitrospirae bacterium]|nr:caspase family protein [Nitrospirota bacterium]